MREVHLMSETRIMDIIELVDKSSRVINLKIRLRMTALQFGIRHSANKPDALQNRGRLRLSNRLRTLLYMCSAQIMGTESVAYTHNNKGSCFLF